MSRHEDPDRGIVVVEGLKGRVGVVKVVGIIRIQSRDSRTHHTSGHANHRNPHYRNVGAPLELPEPNARRGTLTKLFVHMVLGYDNCYYLSFSPPAPHFPMGCFGLAVCRVVPLVRGPMPFAASARTREALSRTNPLPVLSLS